MRVLLINTSERAGGAAIAASRLTDALNQNGVKAKLLVRDKTTDRPTTVRLSQQLKLRWTFLWERLRIWMANGFKRQGLWEVDIANAGADITALPEFREADIIHLHWVNQGLLSMRQLKKIMQSGKPIVWTMHDMWPCTAICHHARECEHYHNHCHNCPQLLRPCAHDLSYQVFERKVKAYTNSNITFVGCSQWIADEARKSALLNSHQVVSIPNTYDAHLFYPFGDESRVALRRQLGLPERRRLVLFACQKVTNVHKGLDYLIQALQSPTLAMLSEQMTVVVVGQMAESVAQHIPFPIRTMGYISSETTMAQLYQAVDLFVTPSLEENLPNTIMEAMACGTPCVGFRIGGIPEMIDHQVNGYVASYRDAEDLATGINYSINPLHYDRLAKAAAEKALRAWNVDTVVRRYTTLYESLISEV